MPTAERIDLPTELRRIAREMDDANRPGRQYCLSKYDSDLLRDAATEMDRRAELPATPARVYLLERTFGFGDRDLEGIYSTQAKADEASERLARLDSCGDRVVTEVELDKPLIVHDELT